MYEPRIIQLFHQLCSRPHIGSIAAFISQRPHHDTGTIIISRYQCLGPVQDSFLKPLIGCQQGNTAVTIASITGQIIINLHTAMGFHVIFINHIQTIPITQLIKQRRIRIVGGSHCIDIMPLHQYEILFHLCNRAHISGFRIAVVTVHTTEFHRYIIDFHHTAFNNNLTETYFIANDFFPGRQGKSIQLRSFCRP